MSFLERIVAAKRNEVSERKKNLPLQELERSLPSSPARDFRSALEEGRCALIAEVKRKSPSKGILRQDFDPAEIASAYERSGAAAISVLTDEPFFGGSAADLIRVRSRVGVPVLRKDFVVDPYQVAESRVMGADALLLIVAVLGDALRAYLELAGSLGIHALVEVHERDELEIALAAGAEIIGINHRDLRTFEIDLTKSAILAPLIPDGTSVVAESGIRTKEDIRRLMETGVHAFLVGETLMKADDVGERIRGLLAP
jgi:indole-3-glycerol phosphate synthase